MIASTKKPQVRRSEDGYAIFGLEPPELAQSHGFFRKMFWGWVVTFGLKEKDKDLAKGLNKDGKPLAPISEYTRKHRKSAMTGSGEGDPEAPPLIPAWQKSRTRSLLTGRAYEDHAEFFWKFDAFTGDSWATILEHQAERGRDVFGLSPEALERVKKAAWKRWELYKKGLYDEPEAKKPQRPPEPKPKMEFGYVNIRGQTIAERIAYFRQTAPALLPGRPMRPKVMSPISGPLYNRLLGHSFGVPPKPQKPPKPLPIPVRRPSPYRPSDLVSFLKWLLGK